MLAEHPATDKLPKITLNLLTYTEKKNDLQLALRNNLIISLGPTNPGRYHKLLTDIINLNYQFPSPIYFNDLITHMNEAYQEYLQPGLPYKKNLSLALTALLKFLYEAFNEEFNYRKLNEQFSELNIQYKPVKPVKPSLRQSIADACCGFFSCCKIPDKDDTSINHRATSERARLLK